MESVRRAVIDVGTNSIKLLVADLAGLDIRPVCEESRQTRLGQDFYQTHLLQPGPIAKTAEAVADFAGKARSARADSIRVIATSAARDALNSQELVSAIQRACGLSVEIISGEREADWAFRGVTSDPALARRCLLILDVGGGSTEFILGQGDQRQFCQSFPMGTVRLLDQLPHSDPPTAEQLAGCRQRLQEFLRAQVEPRLAPVLFDLARAPGGQPPVELVGTGGTASILACMEAQLTVFDRTKLEATRLTRERVQWHVETLWRLPLEARKRVVGLPPNRADVILTGTAIYEAVMGFFGLPHMRVSTRGLRFAALLDPAP